MTKAERREAGIKNLKIAQKRNKELLAERRAKGIFRSVAMRLTLTEDAFAIVGNLPYAEARDIISEAVRRAAKTR